MKYIEIARGNPNNRGIIIPVESLVDYIDKEPLYRSVYLYDETAKEYVEKNGSLIASAFLYFTNSTMGYIDYLIADPKYREDDRQDVLVQLAAHATGVAVKSGCEQVWAMTTNKKLIQMVTGKSMPMEVLPDTYKVLYVYDKRTSRLND